MAQRQRLSPNSVQVLISIAAGRTYPQIIKRHPHLTYLDITEAAKEALRINESPEVSEPIAEAHPSAAAKRDRRAEHKLKYPRAYQRWTSTEDNRLTNLHLRGKTVDELATEMKRHPVAVRLRLVKLGWIEEPFPSEEERQPDAPSVAVNAPATAGTRPNPLPAARPGAGRRRWW
jgi:hypothetical protein